MKTTKNAKKTETTTTEVIVAKTILTQEQEIAEMQAALEAKQKAFDDAKMKLAEEKKNALLALPASMGFTSMDDFIVALRKASTVNKEAAPRNLISNETRAKVAAALVAGKTAKEAAAEFGISEPSVNLIKKAAGLVKVRAEKTVGTPETTPHADLAPTGDDADSFAKPEAEAPVTAEVAA